MLTPYKLLSLLQLVFILLVDYVCILQSLLKLPYRLLLSLDLLRSFGEFPFEYAVQPCHRVQGGFNRDFFRDWQQLNSGRSTGRRPNR